MRGLPIAGQAPALVEVVQPIRIPWTTLYDNKNNYKDENYPVWSPDGGQIAFKERKMSGMLPYPHMVPFDDDRIAFFVDLGTSNSKIVIFDEAP